ncbi:ABC transporter ATP-binding protein [Corynebacterium sp. ES2775-CONJ]|uniref:ABC transporter ATP-binding protein n=1 Tax=Corynebacterium sp. ES2775-CONJ TaxID=2974029 RepID=UPI002169AA81|nr:ABC transporter ATP-binding protein [Corynebacterium sp. ES2775-CONJ]MCS4490515.1 ABC transporter ATP-binding protein/permease [Corynebacterium sp. ES2775-CONJ]
MASTSTISAPEREKLKREREEGKSALKELLRPIALRLGIGRFLAIIAGFLAIGPYIALIQVGDTLYSAYSQDLPVDEQSVWASVYLLVGMFCGRLFFNAIALAITHFADIRLAAIIRQRILDRISSAPLGWFSKTNAGKVRKALQEDIGQIHALVAHQPVDVTQAIITPVALLMLAFLIDWRLGLLTVASFPFYIAANIWMLSGMGEKTVEMDAHLGRVSATMVEFFTGISVVKAFGAVGQSHKRYQDAADDFSTFYLAWVTPMLKGSAMAAASISIPILMAINLGGGILMIRAGWVTPPDVLATTLIALMIPSAITVLSNMMWAYQLAGAAARRLLITLDTPILSFPNTKLQPRGNEIRFEDVSFSYGEHIAANHVTMTLREDTVTALIGASGSGKTTLATLVARFNDPDSGRITIGGVDVRELSTRMLYDTVSFVLQDPQLLRISVRDNIALGRLEATMEEIRDAAHKAHILDTIEALPKGFDTIVGTDTHFSGGQAQRIAIARALLVDAPILILDEATAFADPESEADIQQALTTLVKGKTVLVIAHRLESIVGADQIIVLEHGHVAAAGSAKDLQGHPLYQQLLTTSQSAHLRSLESQRKGH